MNRIKLIEILEQIVLEQQTEISPWQHMSATAALLQFIDDEEVTKLFILVKRPS